MKASSVTLLAVAGLVSSCLLPEEHEAELERRMYGRRISKPRLSRRQQGGDAGYPVGTGDRFSDGTVPRGIGIDNDKDFESILNIKEVASGVQALANAYPDLQMWTAPNMTIDGNSMTGLTLGEKPRVFIEGGIHARERGGPDFVLYFLADLLAAGEAGTGVSYGDQSYTADQVKTALSAGIVLLPLVNPDGVDFDQQSNSCWRKNRNPASSDGSDPSTIGVDLNRNFDFLWDYTKAFSSDADLTGAASEDPSSEVFHGTAPFSEVETQNIAWVMDQHDTLSWFLDLHSYSGDILYGWGDDDWQTTDTSMNFQNTADDGERGVVGDNDPSNAQYGEYVTAADKQAELSASSTMINSMNNAGGSGNSAVEYIAQQSCHLYPTSGGSNDYALGRYYGKKCGASKLYGLTIEFGYATRAECPFYPEDADTYTTNMKQVAAGLMELVLNAAGDAGVTTTVQC